MIRNDRTLYYLEQTKPHIAHVLASRSAAAEISDSLKSLDAGFVYSFSGQEADTVWKESSPDLLIVHRSYLLKHAGSLEEYTRNCAGITFTPTIYVGQYGDPEFPALTHFKSVQISNGDLSGLKKLAGNHLKLSVRVKFWGVRGSTPCANSENIHYGGNTSCVEITAPGLDELLILDSGTGIRNLGNYLSKKRNKKLSGRIFITHPHWDHIQGFPFFKPFYCEDNRFHIHMPEQYRGGAQEILSGHLTKTFFPVSLDMLDADLTYITQGESLKKYGPYSVEYLVANHPTKTAIYKIRIGGRTIIYCPDNELPLKQTPIRFLDAFESFIRDSDLMIHDAQFDLKQYENREGWGHSAWERVIEIARKNNVKSLFLTHHDPDANDDLLSAREESVNRYSNAPFESVALAREGTEVRLPVAVAQG